MPSPDKRKWNTQYKADFRPRRCPRQVPKRPSSATRRNNPQPITDFLVYDRQPTTREEEVHAILRAAVTRSAPPLKGQPSDISAIPVGPLPSSEPEKELSPHWSQWPQPPKTHRPQQAAPVVSPRLPHSARTPRATKTVVPVAETEANRGNDMTSMMRYDDHNIIMHRGLSPRRAAPPTMPGRSKTQYAMNYGGFRKHETSSADPFGGLDLHTYPYSAGHTRNPGYTSYGGARESRPMHRHLRNAKLGEEYVHNHSIYYSTTPNVSGYFIIHPDWVSERLSLRRSQSLLSF